LTRDRSRFGPAKADVVPNAEFGTVPGQARDTIFAAPLNYPRRASRQSRNSPEPTTMAEPINNPTLGTSPQTK
jgi:hypothetical protein